MALVLQRLYSQALLYLPVWFESYQLAEEADHPPQFLARWTPPPGYWNGGLDVSADGKWAIFTEPWGDARLAYQRAKLSGRETFQGQELFDLFRSKDSCVLVYDTSTGKLTSRYQSQSAIHSINGWKGNDLAVSAYYARPERQLTLENLRTGAENWNLNMYALTALRKEQIYQLTNGQLQLRQTKSDSLPDSVSLHFQDNQLYGYRYQWGEETKSFYELDNIADQIMVKRELTFPQQGDRHFSGWIPHSTQYVCGANTLYRQCTASLQGKWAWLDSAIKLFGKLFDAEGSIVVIDQRPEGTRECAFQQLPANDSPTSFSQLYLLEVKKNGDQIVSVMLNAYPLPLPISSPWWARIAACLPVVMLAIFVFRRWCRS